MRAGKADADRKDEHKVRALPFVPSPNPVGANLVFALLVFALLVFAYLDLFCLLGKHFYLPGRYSCR